MERKDKLLFHKICDMQLIAAGVVLVVTLFMPWFVIDYHSPEGMQIERETYVVWEQEKLYAGVLIAVVFVTILLALISFWRNSVTTETGSKRHLDLPILSMATAAAVMAWWRVRLPEASQPEGIPIIFREWPLYLGAVMGFVLLYAGILRLVLGRRLARR